MAFARVILVTHPTLDERMGVEFGGAESFWGDVLFPATARDAGVGAVADAAGRFELRAGNGERFSVVAARPGDQTWVRTVVRLRSEEHREGVTVELPATRTVTGRIRAIDGSALEGIVVSGGGRPVTSGHNGRFRLDVSADTKVLDVTDSSRRFVRGRITLPGGSAPAHGLELLLSPAATIVLEVSPSSGAALPEELWISHLAGNTWRSQRTRCPRDGRIVMRGVDASVAHEFEVRPEGGAEVTARAGKLVPGGLTRVPVELASGRVIQGRVVDAAGLPVAGARVSTWAGTMKALSLRGFRMQRSAGEVYTDADGRFSLVRERATVDTVFVGHPDYIGAHAKAPGDAAPVRVVLQRGGGIEGTLVRDGRATAQSIVRARRVGGGYERSDHTRVDGVWRITGLPPGEYRVTTGSGEAELAAIVSVATGGVVRVDLK